MSSANDVYKRRKNAYVKRFKRSNRQKVRLLLLKGVYEGLPILKLKRINSVYVDEIIKEK